ncbi:hypothetical protein ACFW1A_04660 [Kitasatospora sp. NPDC058965]|uniref:hypothetical protein n=1 Tax=Kitasatospora sp. NPDC058965 TaxID=3346682 RepID=UPI0036BD4D23
MHLITTQLVGPASTPIDPQLLAYVIRSHAEPADRVEHLRVHVEPGRIGLAVFLLADNEADAEQATRRLCHRALENTPLLAQWHLLAS